jgi:SOS-response transcriptional repressor LexA
MQKKRDFAEWAANLSNGELYVEFRKYYIREELGERGCSWRVEILGREARRRDARIIEDAAKDALTTANSIRLAGHGLKVTNILRLDHLEDSEVDSMLQTIGAARRHDRVAEDDNRITSMFDLFGIERDNLLICQVSGESMTGANIHEGDRLLIDTGARPVNGSIIVANIDGNIFVKRLSFNNGDTWLISENKNFAPVKLTLGSDFEILGVVRHIVHSA